MPRVPKIVPQWLPEFCEYGREKEKKAATRDALNTFEDVLERRWDKFVDKKNEEAPPPKKRKPADPVKSLENAMKKVAKEVDGMPEGDAQLEQVRDRLRQSMPPQVQALLQAEPSPVQSDVLQQIEDLYNETTGYKNILESLASTVPAENAAFKTGALDAVNNIGVALETIKTKLAAAASERGDVAAHEQDDKEQAGSSAEEAAESAEEQSKQQAE